MGQDFPRGVLAVSGNWRLTFLLKDNEVFDLDLEDYH